MRKRKRNRRRRGGGGEGEEEEEEEGESQLEDMAPTPKRRKLARETALKVSLRSRLYPVFRGLEGSTQVIAIPLFVALACQTL